MRKIMFLMALLMTATWMFTSCTDEENGDDGKIPPEEVPGTEEQQLIYSFVKERDALSSEVVIGIELKNIDTEHSSLQTEYESIKNVISKNIERTFNFYKNA